MANHPNQVGQVQLPSRESVTEHQIAVLRGVMNDLCPYLLGPAAAFHDWKEPAKIDGGIAASASVTFMNLCSRLDTVLEDTTRWSTAAHDELYASIHAVQKAQVTFLTEQAESVRSLRRPSFQLRPTLANDGDRFVAYYGDITKAGRAIIGVGATPNDALLSFDAAFDRASAEQVVMIAEDKGISVESPTPEPTPEPKRKKKTT